MVKLEEKKPTTLKSKNIKQTLQLDTNLYWNLFSKTFNVKLMNYIKVLYLTSL
jgi:hypothetical protein